MTRTTIDSAAPAGNVGVLVTRVNYAGALRAGGAVSRRRNGANPRPTSHDVAHAAGVSRATVSYVLNETEGHRISPATRRRVWDAVARLQYTPDAGARLLKTGKSDVVLIALPDWTPGQLMYRVLHEIAHRLGELGYTPLLDLAVVESPTSFSRACERIQPIAVVAPAVLLPPKVARGLRTNGTRAILPLGDLGGVPAPNAANLQATIGGLALSYLAERGRRRVLAVMPDDPRLVEFREGRLQGARDAPGGSRLRVVDVALDLKASRAAIVRAVRRRPGADAVFAYNDEYALLTLHALADAGVDVPGEVAVIGCDDLPFAPLARPSLTSIAFGDLGTRMADHLHALIEHGRPAGRLPMALPPVVVRRESA